MENKAQALEAIRRKLIGKTLTYDEIYSIMSEISQKKLGDILTTYFAASGYTKGFTDTEIYYLTKAMIETGEKLTFKGIRFGKNCFVIFGIEKLGKCRMTKDDSVPLFRRRCRAIVLDHM